MIRRTAAVALCLLAGGARAQTLPLPPGAGFQWEHVGDRPVTTSYGATFDAGGTLWLSNDLQWLDLRGGWPGVWVMAHGPILPWMRGDDVLTLGGHPAGGLPRADTVLVTLGATRRSTNGGYTAEAPAGSGDYVLYEIPAWHAHAGRLLVGGIPAFSDDRGASWSPVRYQTSDLPFGVEGDFFALPPPALLPGAVSGRDVAAPAGWPSGRIVGVGNGGVAVLSDDGGDTYVPANHLALGRRTQGVTVVRRPDTHPLGPGPRLIAAGTGDAAGVSVWLSDDAGLTWTRRATLPEPVEGPGAPLARGVYALPEPGESDPGAGGRALVVLAMGHLYQTVDGGETWAVVGRIPDAGANAAVEATEMGPDGRLYVLLQGRGQPKWVWRTAEPFAVAASEAPPSASGLAVTVHPNPSSGETRVRVTVSSASAETTVEVFDALGRQVAALHAGPLASGERSFSLDTTTWAPGVYTARVASGGKATSVRFTVTR